ncbi:MAG: phytanoyl-CoA dioxygenase family protein [Flavobacteriales bacterium]|nr:phytanoyl-CoA dioxygenase family protein [Flavobacteriales bacterium]
MEPTNWANVFQNEGLNNTLKKDGIVKFELPDFDPIHYNQILHDLVIGYPNAFEKRFYGSVEIAEMDVKRKIHEKFQELISPSIENQLINHKLLSYFFLVKGIGEKSILHLHQDWSIIDERQFRAYNLWIPLCNSTTKNGTLYAIKGSHNFPLNIRGAGIPSKYGGCFSEAKKYLEPIKVKAGEALLFDSRLLHYSPQNNTKKSRTAIINNVIPSNAENMCFHGNLVKNKLEINSYAVPNDLFIHYDDFSSQKDLPNPKGKFLEMINYGNVETASIEGFKELLQKNKVKKRSFYFLR